MAPTLPTGKPHVNLLDAAPEEVRPPARRRARRLDRRRSREQPLQRDRGLDAGERSAEAVVRPVAEAEVRVGMAGEVEVLGIGETPGIPVGRGLDEEDKPARLDAAPIEL